MRILLAEDNDSLSDWLARLLRRENFVVDCVADGEAADAVLRTQSFDLVVLDLALPGLRGDQVLRRLRARDPATPVLVLTANDAMSSRVAQLDAGADDYMVKPFDIAELEARIRVLLRRRGRDRRSNITCGPLAFDATARTFTLHGEALHLTAREHAVLEALLLSAGRTVTKTTLTDTIAGMDDSLGPNAVEVYVHRVRRKVESQGVSIRTLRGIGYILQPAG